MTFCEAQSSYFTLAYVCACEQNVAGCSKKIAQGNKPKTSNPLGFLC